MYIKLIDKSFLKINLCQTLINFGILYPDITVLWYQKRKSAEKRLNLRQR